MSTMLLGFPSCSSAATHPGVSLRHTFIILLIFYLSGRLTLLAGPASWQTTGFLWLRAEAADRVEAQLALGSAHTCALFKRINSSAGVAAAGGGPAVDNDTVSYSAVKCWGANLHGQLGLSDSQDRGTQPGHMGAALPPVDLGPNVTAVALLAGSRHTCALLQPGGLVKCWGNNADEQLGRSTLFPMLGDKNDQMGAALPPLDFGPGLRAEALAAGVHHTCALLQPGGHVRCWGNNTHGQLGVSRLDMHDMQQQQYPPVDLGPGLQPVALAAGAYHTCALLQPGGLVKCWGYNEAGQLGQGDTTNRGDSPGHMGAALHPVDLGPGLAAVAVAAGGWHTCALLQPGGLVKCWGHNNFGQLGLGGTISRGNRAGDMGAALPPVDLGPEMRAVAVTAGSRHTCALLQPGGLVKCWGAEEYAISKGDSLGSTGTRLLLRGTQPGHMGTSLPPVDLGPGLTAVAVAAGGSHTCAVLQPGHVVKCWGDNWHGQLGQGNTVGRADEPQLMGANMPPVDLGW